MDTITIQRNRHALFVMLLVFTSLLILGVPGGKALVIALFVFGASVLNLGARWFARGALVLFVVASVAWSELLPLARWGTWAGHQLASGPCSLQTSALDAATDTGTK